MGVALGFSSNYPVNFAPINKAMPIAVSINIPLPPLLPFPEVPLDEL